MKLSEVMETNPNPPMLSPTSKYEVIKEIGKGSFGKVH